MRVMLMVFGIGVLFAQFASASCLKFDGFHQLKYCYGFSSDNQSFTSGIKLPTSEGAIDIPEQYFQPRTSIQVTQEGCEKVSIVLDQSPSMTAQYTSTDSSTFKSTIGNNGLVVSRKLRDRTQVLKVRKNIFNELILVYGEVATDSHFDVVEKRIRCAFAN